MMESVLREVCTAMNQQLTGHKINSTGFQHENCLLKDAEDEVKGLLRILSSGNDLQARFNVDRRL